jgi:exodeoxyribonuclease VII large subunit
MSWTDSTETASGAEAISVSVLIQRAKSVLERALPLCWVSGEISGFKRAASGHCYFDLKDDAAQIACVLYRNRAALVGFELKDGAQVEVRVRPSIYEPRGSLQFTVEQARLAGVGRLYEAFLRLKAKLDAEGLFAGDRKRDLPPYPRQIGLITSTKAAALADMLRVLRDRWPRAPIILYPASVQGANAPRELLSALDAANMRAECDVLIIGRGGGSIEDLWAFNDEALVRAVAASKIPIVSAVGHETDFTLCDFAADVRAATPTAAAALITPEREAMNMVIDELRGRIVNALHDRLNRVGERLDRANERLRSSSAILAPWREKLLRTQARLHRAITATVPSRRTRLTTTQQKLALQLTRLYTHAPRLQHAALSLRSAGFGLITRQSARIDRSAQALELLNPDHVLDRGYALIFNDADVPITHPVQVAAGDRLRIRVKRGDIGAVATGTSSDMQQQFPDV